ncbi:MAG: T9SS type A sorting domain-containing protein [Bacteroidetes bacterium]|jgi:hypothetical protein|nr:T9SS type A sorting domain-containing protein [Bacteroidota bacterium]
MKKLITMIMLTLLNLAVVMIAGANTGSSSYDQSSIAVGAITGPAAVCLNQTGVNYSVEVVPGVIDYNWSVPVGASIASGQGTNSIVVDFTNTFGDICVTADDGTGPGAPSCVTTFLAPGKPLTPTAINGPTTTVCPNHVYTYTVPADPLASSYNWVVPNYMSIIDGQGTTTINVSVATGFIWGYLRVSASNCRGTTGQYTIGVFSAPGRPGAVTGPAVGACPGGTYTYSVAPVVGATSYTWYAPAGCVISTASSSGNPLTSSTNSVDITFPIGFTYGSLFVSANSGCNSSPRRELKIRSVPQKPGGIHGPFYGVCDMSSVMYWVDSVPGASTYSWSFTPGTYTTISGNGNDTIYVDFNSAFRQATLCVTADNSCGSSVARCGVVFARPQTPGLIDGPTGACNSNPLISQAFYQIQPVFGAIEYVWTVPPGASIVIGQGTTQLTVEYLGASSGNVTVAAQNDCGISPARVVGVIVNPCRMGGDGSILSNTVSVFPNPAKDKLAVQFESTNTEKYSIRLIDITGREVLAINRESITGINNETIDLSEFSKGLYILNVIREQGQEKIKVVIE